eukprot:m.222265 g.222265  ORF g.222265 m.222265 type:complete len:90 (-) comp33368_c0_seq2:2-271(-)
MWCLLITCTVSLKYNGRTSNCAVKRSSNISAPLSEESIVFVATTRTRDCGGGVVRINAVSAYEIQVHHHQQHTIATMCQQQQQKQRNMK